jgi:hypothetical protein
MLVHRSIGAACLAVCLALGSAAWGGGIQVDISATADERGGQEPDVFGLGFGCDCDVHILQAIYDMSSSAGHLFFDTQPSGSGAWDFHVLPDAFFPTIISSDVGPTALSADGSPQLVVNFSNFGPNKTLYFDIDVDGPDCTTFTAARFAGTYLGIVFDPSPAFPGALPYGIAFRFTDQGGLAVVQGEGTVPVPEPATVALLAGGSLALVALRRRNRR